MKIIETERLILREVVESDGEFILDLLNQPSFIKYIGDRNVRNVDEAKEFIENRYRASYAEHGFGLYTVELKSEISDFKFQISNRAIGICGFVKRETLPDADIGFAFLPQFEKQGFAFESANAMMNYGRDVLGLKRVLAITTKDNESSGRLLAKLGFEFENLIDSNGEELKLYRSEPSAVAGGWKLSSEISKSELKPPATADGSDKTKQLSRKFAHQTEKSEKKKQ